MGDWVHYHERLRLDAPMVTMMALITEVIADDGRVRLVAFHPTEGVKTRGVGVMFSETPAAERWTWPPEGK